MFFLAATGKIDPNSIRLNGDHVVFILQVDRSNCYRVKTSGLEQYDLVQSIQPGETVFLLGTAENHHKITITPWVIMLLDQIDGNKQAILQAARQIMETQL